jgi:hypothetical protein
MVMNGTRKVLENTPKVDHKAWARKILDDVAAGVKRSPTVIQMAKNALKEAV